MRVRAGLLNEPGADSFGEAVLERGGGIRTCDPRVGAKRRRWWIHASVCEKLLPGFAYFEVLRIYSVLRSI